MPARIAKVFSTAQLSQDPLELDLDGPPPADFLDLATDVTRGSDRLAGDPPQAAAPLSEFPGAAGTSTLGLAAAGSGSLPANTFLVSSDAGLNVLVSFIDLFGSATAYTIQLTANITLATDLTAINLPAGASLTVDGGGFKLDGAGLYRGFFVYSGTVTIQNLTIADAAATGGAAGPGGGGGAGLGGGLFVAAAANVTLNAVGFSGDRATGGTGSNGSDSGGGGFGGSGGKSRVSGGGGIGVRATGGDHVNGLNGSDGIVVGASGGGGGRANGSVPGGFGGTYGGGGGGGNGGGGGGIGGADGGFGFGGAGGFGGGGGGGFSGGGDGGFGGGGGSGAKGGNGGFGGGGGSFYTGGGNGGFGGGGGGSNGGSGGGGLGAGGDIFVQHGGGLTIGNASLAAGTVQAGTGSGAGSLGSAFGSGIFIQGNNTLTFAPRAGQTLTIAGVIADQTGSGGTGINAGAGSLLVSGGDTVFLGTSNTYTGGTAVSGGTMLEIGVAGAAGTGAIALSGTGNTLRLDQASSFSLNNVITGFAAGDVLDFTTLPYSITIFGHTSFSTAALSGTRLFVANLPFLDNLTLTGIAPGTSFVTSPDSGTGTLVTIACFAAGTRIATERGKIAVEHLRVDDMALTASGGRRSVRWIGHRRIDLARHPDPRLAQPIRIRADAFADGVPKRDLLVSPDHALLIDGMLIPARLLANGATVLRDPGFSTIQYFHVELDRHDILLAEGLPAESFLDTGNRGIFENAAAPLVLHPDFPLPDGQARREAGSCAPFAADADRVEPVWRQLAARAALLGQAIAAPATTNDPDLRIVVDGRTLRAVSTEGGRHVFLLPGNVQVARLVSRAAAPCDAAPWLEDRRRLGVMVRAITLHAGAEWRDIAMDDPMLADGWWDAERNGIALWRWTDGDAKLPGISGPAILEVEVGATMAYPILDPAKAATRLAA